MSEFMAVAEFEFPRDVGARDYEEWSPGRGTHCVYVLSRVSGGGLFKAEMEHVYVGVSSNVRQRLRQHAANPVMTEVANYGAVSVHDTRALAEAFERALISSWEPDLNIAERGGL